MSPVPILSPQGETRNIRAADVRTGDVLLPGDKIVTQLSRKDDGNMVVTVANVQANQDSGIPLVVVDDLDVTMHENEQISVIRGRPLINGMHMTQIDVRGICYAYAHPVLEAKLRAEGRISEDYRRAL